MLQLAFLFALGSVIGWGGEVIFRRIFSAHRFVNPGALIGPYLPLYGFSACILYLLASLEPLLKIETVWLEKLVLFVGMAVAITLLELVAGLIFVHGMKMKLWDYSAEKGNFMGIICPRFSCIWVALSAIYYFLIHPHILSALDWLSVHLTFSFFVGAFYGVFVVDVVYSLQLLVKIRNFAAKSKIVVRIEQLQGDAREWREQNHQKRRFFFSLSTNLSLKVMLEKYRDKYGVIARTRGKRRKEEEESAKRAPIGGGEPPQVSPH